jgi:glycerol kinase
MPGLILAIDQGTTNTKALLVDKAGRVIYSASTPVDLITPRPGYVEQDPVALWSSVVAASSACVAQAAGETIEGVSLSNQRETAVAWHRGSGEPVANAISWQCRRSEPVCARLAPHAESIRSRTGLPLDPLVSGSKWAWLLENNAKSRQLAAAGDLCLGTVDSWLIYKLTGGKIHATDHSNASRTALLNLSSLDWDDELLALFGVPRSAMPELLSSSGHLGVIASISELVGVPVISAIGDSHAALFGHGRFLAGTVKATYGTGSSLMTLAEGLPGAIPTLARTVAWSIGGKAQYALEGNITMTGSAVQWVGEFLGLENPVADAVALAESVADAAGVYFVPAMVGLGAPYWDTTARGSLTGLSRTSTRAHMARAAIDAIAYQVADVFHEMQSSAGISLPALHADGGATRNAALMQFQSNVLKRPVHRSACEDLSALGAAWLGGHTLGWWKHLSEIEALIQDDTTFEPQEPFETGYAGWKHAVALARTQEVAS